MRRLAILLSLVSFASLGAITFPAPVYLTNPAGTLNVTDTVNNAIRVNIVAGAAAGGTSSSFAAAFPASGTAVGFKDNGGNMAAGTLDVSGFLKVNCAAGCAGAADSTGAAAINALNARASVALAGDNTAGVFIAAGTLAATVVPECSWDGGTTWKQTFFVDPTTLAQTTSLVFTNPSAATTEIIFCGGGARNAGVRASLFTSGTATATVTAVQQQNTLLAFSVGTGTPVPAAAAYVGMSVGGNLTGMVGTANGLKVDGSAVTQPVSGTVTANIGTTNGLALDASVTGLQVAQASTTSGQKGGLVQGAVTTAAPTYTTGQTDPLSLTTAGALRVDGSGATQPVSGTITANAGSGTFATSSTQLPAALDGSGFLKTHEQGTATISGTVTANIGTSGSLALDASVTGLQVAQGSTTAGQKGGLALGAVTTAAPTYTTAQSSPLSLQTDGSLRVAVANALPAGTNVIGHVIVDTAPTTTVTGTVTSNQGTAAVTAGAWPVKVTDGTNTATVKAASTAAVDADTALVVVERALGCAGRRLSETNFTSINLASTTATTIITGVAAQNVYICQLTLSATGGAVNLAVIEGTTATCATGAAGLWGGTTAATGLGMAAQGGFVIGDGAHVIGKTATQGDNVCLLASAATQISGKVAWVSF